MLTAIFCLLELSATPVLHIIIHARAREREKRAHRTDDRTQKRLHHHRCRARQRPRDRENKLESQKNSVTHKQTREAAGAPPHLAYRLCSALQPLGHNRTHGPRATGHGPRHTRAHTQREGDRSEYSTTRGGSRLLRRRPASSSPGAGEVPLLGCLAAAAAACTACSPLRSCSALHSPGTGAAAPASFCRLEPGRARGSRHPQAQPAATTRGRSASRGRAAETLSRGLPSRHPPELAILAWTPRAVLSCGRSAGAGSVVGGSRVSNSQQALRTAGEPRENTAPPFFPRTRVCLRDYSRARPPPRVCGSVSNSIQYGRGALFGSLCCCPGRPRPQPRCRDSGGSGPEIGSVVYLWPTPEEL